MQGHKYLKEVEEEAALHGVFYLATAYELHHNLNIQEYSFDRQALDEYLDSLEEKLENGKSLLHYFAELENSSIFIYLFKERQKAKSQLDTLTGKVIKETPLHLAIKRGCTSVAQFLLEQGADIKKGRYGEHAKTVLHGAAEYGREEIVDLLLQHKDIQEILNLPQGDKKYTALHLAAVKGHFSILRKLIDCGAHTEQQDLLSRTPLEVLLEHESLDFKVQEECACLLLSKKTPPFFQLDNPKLTQCFINALKQGLLFVAQRLAENGLPPLKEQEHSFLEIAAHGAFQKTYTLSPEPIEIPQEKRSAYIRMIRWLLAEKKVDPNQPFKDRSDFLIHQVCYAGCSELLSLLIELKADLKKLDSSSSQNSALHHACQSLTDCVGIVRLLLGYDPALLEAKNIYGQTPLHLAALRGNVKSAEYLLNQIAEQRELNQQDYQGNTPLHLAVIGERTAFNLAKENYVKIVEALLKKGANLNILNREQKTALMLAFASGSEALIQVLSQAALLPQQLINSLRKLYLSQKKLSIFRIKAEEEWEFEVPLEEIYVRLGMIEREERKARDQALGKHSDYLQDGRIQTYETIFEPKQNIELEKLFEHQSLAKRGPKRIYLQGAAGSGKSTLCHYIAYRWAKGDLWQEIFSYLFWIPLRNFTKEKYPADKEYTPADLIAREYAGKIDPGVIEACIHNSALQEKTLLILDGYDELSADAQRNISLAKAFKELKVLFPHILITSRPGGCSFNRSCDLELLGFDKEGIGRYIDRFFKEVQAEEKKVKLYHLLNTSPQVLSLAHTPINLALLCCLFNEDPGFFDSNHSITMTAIYERMVNWMYKWFLLRRVDLSQSKQTKEKIFEEKDLRHNSEVSTIATAFEDMAFFAMEKDSLYLSREKIDEVRGDSITSNELTDCGLMRIPAAEEKGYFIHLTFQEFLTASKIANQYLKGERQACRNFVRQYKFEPRYSLVLRMIAGYLSNSTPSEGGYSDYSALQAFFDDLFAEPHDLAVRSELHLIAECFEECQNPKEVRQYKGFIKMVIEYIKHLSLIGLNFERLLRNKNILNHPKMIGSIGRLLSGPQTRKNMLSNLASIIKTGSKLASETVGFITEVLKDPDSGSTAKCWAADILSTMTEQGEELPKESVDSLIQISKESNQISKESNSFVKMPFTNALGTVVQQGGKLAKEALIALTQILKEGDFGDKFWAAYVLEDIAKQGGKFAKEALTILATILTEGDIEDKIFAASSLAAVGGELAENGLDALIQIFKEGSVDDKLSAVHGLEKVAKQRGKLAKKALAVFAQILKEEEPAVKISTLNSLRMMAMDGNKLSKEVLDALLQALKEGDSDAKRSIAITLSKVAEQGGKLSEEMLAALFQFLEEGDSTAKIYAAEALKKLAEQGDRFPKKVLAAFFQIFKKGDAFVAHSAAPALAALVSQGEVLAKEGLTALIQILKEAKGEDAFAIDYAASAVLAIAVEQGGELAKESLAALIQILREGDDIAKYYAVSFLEAVAKQGGELAKESLAALIQILKEGDDTAKYCAVSVLTTVAKQGGELAEEALAILIQISQKGDDPAKSDAACALAKVVNEEGEFAKKALAALMQIFKGGDDPIKGSIVSVLAAVNERCELAKGVLATFIQILKEGNDFAKYYAAGALKKVAMQGGKLSKEAVDVLIRVLAEGRALPACSAASALAAVAIQGGKFAKKALAALTRISKEGNFFSKFYAADALETVAKQGGKVPKEAAEAAIRIHNKKDGKNKYAIDFSKMIKPIDFLGRMIEQGGELAKEALAALMRIFEEDESSRISIVYTLEKVDRNTLLKISIEAFPLVAMVCFLTADSFSVKDLQLQITDKRTTYLSKPIRKLSYEQIREKLPTELGEWRKRLDILSQRGSFKKH
ncbi:ankyrin repeat domain-containing protein [Parachlamydia sp. AcF125]|uniref:ankyrin repeat domain-containing protein n=1 Tax=Parachlamydia sp. AcF125 TaxID=2795736 RepID=UPI001BC902BD